jgi:type II secretory pathway component PulC
MTGAAAASAPAPLELRGVVSSANPMAIIRRGEARYFAHIGEKIEGQYLVTAIEPTRVVLKNKAGNKTILQLGGGA